MWQKRSLTLCSGYTFPRKNFVMWEASPHGLRQNLFVHCRILLLLLLLLSSLPNSSSIMTLLQTTTNSNYGNDVQHKEENPVVDNVATVIPDNFTMGGGGVYPSDYEGHLQGKMISNEDIRDRIREIAKQIRYDYKGIRPVLLCTLKGACPVRYAYLFHYGSLASKTKFFQISYDLYLLLFLCFFLVCLWRVLLQ